MEILKWIWDVEKDKIKDIGIWEKIVIAIKWD